MKLLSLLATVLLTVIPHGTAQAHTEKAPMKCPQWTTTAIKVGWKKKDIKTLDRLMHRESRCRPKALNTTLNRNGSWDYGLLQINDRTWCIPSKYSSKGYLQSKKVLKTCEELLTPVTNLVAALAVYKAAGNSFSPWGE